MCHLLLALPLVALPVLWILPLPAALPVYGAVTAISLLVYWFALQALRRPVATGMEGMVSETGRVVEAGGAEVLVQIHNELWRAESDGGPLHEGDRIEVVGSKERTLVVRVFDPRARFLEKSGGARPR